MHQSYSSVSPFQAKTGMPAAAMAGRVILRRVDVAARPGDLGAELEQRLDEDRRLDRHVEAARDARATERLGLPYSARQRHEPGHLLLGDADLFATPVRELDVRDLVAVLLARRAESHRGEGAWMQTRPARICVESARYQRSNASA
jgi:hypothetical protein